MPNLPAPSGDSALHGGDLPVQDSADVLAEFPRPHRNPAIAPIRDAFAAAWAEGFKAYQNISADAAARVDPMRAQGSDLRAFAEEHGVVPGAGERDDSVRSRLFQAPQIVTPNAILAGINAILAPNTTGRAQLSELEMDGMFLHAETTVTPWESYVGAVDPDYPLRRYDLIPTRRPGAGILSRGFPRTFFVRIPSLDANDADVTYVLDADDEGVFVANGSDSGGSESDGTVATSVFVNPQTANDLYAQIVGFVQSIKGQGIAWACVVDPKL